MRTVLLLLVLSVLSTGPTYAQPTIFPDLYGGDLVGALVGSYAPASVLSEAASKDTLYAVVDRVTVDGQDGTVGLYTGLFVPFDCDPSCDPSQDVYDGGGGLNQEHVWPRSLGAGSGLAERDMHHLFPSRVAVNSARSNLPFGESPDEETTAWYVLDQEQATPPADDPAAWSELLGGVRFEPREEKKGDVARALFYVYAVYGPAGTGQADGAFFEAMKETLLAWHEADLPTAEEVARSERVAAYQATASGEPAINPFVHDATLARRAFFGTVLYVRQGTDLDRALQTGASWESAFDDLQAGLEARRSEVLRSFVREVWVAEGTYLPTRSGDRFERFSLDADRIYGGFVGTEISLDERDWEANPTVLSGELGVPGDYSDNSIHIARIGGLVGQGSRPLLDGFVIEAVTTENRDAPPFYTGVGLVVQGGASTDYESTISNCVFRKNGGIALGVEGAAVLQDVRFEENRQGLEAIGSAVTAERVEWTRNGMAIGMEGGRADLRDVRFVANAGALNATGSFVSTPDISIIDAVFERQGSLIIEEIGTYNARGPIQLLDAAATIVNARFEGNESFESNAPVWADASSSVSLANVTFVGNVGGLAGAFAAVGEDVTARLTNVVATANTGSSAGSILVDQYLHDVRVENSILWGNGASNGVPEFVAAGFETEVVFANTIIDGGCDPDEYVSCLAVLDDDPTFMASPASGDDGEWGTGDDDYGDLRLQEGSPAIDFGLAEYLPADEFDLDGDGDAAEPIPFDLDGGERVQGSAVDLGPYESAFAVPSDAAAEVVADGLAAPYPNPSTGHVRVPITLAVSRAAVTVDVLDVLGRRVAVLHDGPLPAGEHALTLEGHPLPAGVYVVRVAAGAFVRTHRFTIVR